MLPEYLQLSRFKKVRSRFTNGRLISRGLFSILEFFPKNERNNLIIVLSVKQKTEFVCSFVFGRIVGLKKKTLRPCLTFRLVILRLTHQKV